MAFIILKNWQCTVVGPEQGIVIWRIMNGEIKGTKEQREFCAKVKKVYLNRANAPQRYLEQSPLYKPRRPLANAERLPYRD